ncbi:MAG: sigma-70 family RNA polymerase sigma factor [Sedimentisphaerales bacterium]|nr:sigma-70 family RNA polymerase sigma factor [Sedimentisphaerales bacterium]
MSLFLRERERLRRIAIAMGMNRTDAEDILQDVSVKVLRYEGTFGEDSDMIRWLIRTTVNQCMTEHRRGFRQSAAKIVARRPEAARPHVAGPGVPEQVGRTEEREIVRRTLLELDPVRLSVMVLRYFCHLSSQEIAQTMKWNASTVRGQLREARLILAGKLLQRGVEP